MKRYIELAMTAVLLVCVWLLSREAAAVSNMAETKTVMAVWTAVWQVQTVWMKKILICPLHGS